MAKPNQKLELLLKQPTVGPIMGGIELAYRLCDNAPTRAFFISTLFFSQRPGYFKTHLFEKEFGLKIFPNNLEHYANGLNKLWEARVTNATALLEKKVIKHKLRLWQNNFLGPFKNPYFQTYFFLCCFYRPGEFEPKNLKECTLYAQKQFENLENGFNFVFTGNPTQWLPSKNFGIVERAFTLTKKMLAQFDLKTEQKEFCDFCNKYKKGKKTALG